MRKAILVGLIAVAALSAMGKTETKDKTPKTLACAVTGANLSVAEATKKHMFTDYKGRRYFFCCDGCPQQFKKDPAKYAKSPSIPTPKSGK